MRTVRLVRPWGRPMLPTGGSRPRTPGGSFRTAVSTVFTAPLHYRFSSLGHEFRTRALPDRRQQPRVPRGLPPAGDDRDLARAADERDLRLRLHARQADDRVRPEADDRGLGRGDVGAGRGLLGVQGGPPIAAR